MDYIPKPTKIDTMFIKIHDEQVRINGIDPIIESSVSSMVADYLDTEEQLYLLLSYYEDRPVSVTARKGEVVWKDRVDVYINTNSKKRLAEAVLKKVRHYLDPSMKRFENAEDAAVIKETAKAWLETIPDSDIVPPSLYPGRVFDRAMVALGATKFQGVMTPPRYDFPSEGVTIDGVFISDEQLATIVEQVGKWVKKHEQPLTAQPEDEEQTPTAQPSEKLREVLERAASQGFVSIDKEGRYHWEGTRPEFGYFAEKAHENKLTRYKWKDLETLFRKKNMRQTLHEIIDVYGKYDVPEFIRSELIDSLFED